MLIQSQRLRSHLAHSFNSFVVTMGSTHCYDSSVFIVHGPSASIPYLPYIIHGALFCHCSFASYDCLTVIFIPHVLYVICYLWYMIYGLCSPLNQLLRVFSLVRCSLWVSTRINWLLRVPHWMAAVITYHVLITVHMLLTVYSLRSLLCICCSSTTMCFHYS